MARAESQGLNARKGGQGGGGGFRPQGKVE